MLIRPILVLIAIVAAIATYFAGVLQGIDERWPALAASIAVGAMLVLLLHLFAGRSQEVGSR
jgi:cyanate permease